MSVWRAVFTDRAKKQLASLDYIAQKQILTYIHDRLETSDDPRRFGKALSHSLRGYWRFRTGDYRMICEFRNEQWIVVVIKVGHRKNVYE